MQLNTYLLFTYITNPVRALQLYGRQKPQAEFWLTILLVCLAQSANMAFLGASHYLLFVGFLIMLMPVFLFLQSAVLDAIAQLFNLPAKTQLLFYWLGFTWLPLLLTLPAAVLTASYPAFQVIYGLVSVITPTLIFLLQLLTLQKIYHISWAKSLAIYLLPTGVMFLLFVLGVILLGLSVFSGLI